MNRAVNPFAAEAAARRGGARRSRIGGWIVAFLMGAACAVLVLIWQSATETIRGLENLHDRVLDDATANQKKARHEIEQGKGLLASLQAQLAGLQKDQQAAQEAAKRLEDQMRSDLESKDVTISKLQGKLTVSIVDRVMFDSGEAVLKPDGEAVLRKVAAILAEHPQLKIHVVGHTDNVPIRNRFPSNWELSTARALAAVHFLTEDAGVAPDRVGALGYGEFRPIGDNSTPEGRARNRRIAITILPDELAGSDASPFVQTNVPVTLQPRSEAVPPVSEVPISETNSPPVEAM